MSTTTVDKRLRDLLNRALDPGTPEPGAVTSAAVLIRHARRLSLNPIRFAEAIGVERQLPPPPTIPPAVERVLNAHLYMGKKHYGRTFAEIADIYFPYLVWMSKEFKSRHARHNATIVVEWIKGGD